MTLEAIGQIYGITRERVRQIENFAVETIRKSDAYSKTKPIFDELEDDLVSHGGLAKEELVLNELGKDELARNQIAFLLSLLSLSSYPFSQVVALTIIKRCTVR